MLERVMKWRLRDARTKMYEAKRVNTRVWRESKQELRDHMVYGAYINLWKRERTLCQLKLKEKLRCKVDTLVRRYSIQGDAEEEPRDIIVGDQPIHEGFSADPRRYWE